MKSIREKTLKNQELEESLLFMACLKENDFNPDKAFIDFSCIQDLLQVQKAQSLMVKRKRTKSYISYKEVVSGRISQAVEEHKEIKS